MGSFLFLWYTDSVALNVLYLLNGHLHRMSYTNRFHVLHMSDNTKRLGQWGEEIAAKYLIDRGYKILDRNYRNAIGEIDIIGKKEGTLIFVEVKTRDSIHADYFLPEQSITPKKQAKLRALCEIYINKHKYKDDQEWQIDVMSISIDKASKRARINHIQNAVYA